VTDYETIEVEPEWAPTYRALLQRLTEFVVITDYEINMNTTPQVMDLIRFRIKMGLKDYFIRGGE
jgi:hypothetical protein